jgi:hypothetical protein
VLFQDAGHEDDPQPDPVDHGPSLLVRASPSPA